MKFTCKYHKSLKILGAFLALFALVLIIAALSTSSNAEKIIFVCFDIFLVLFFINVYFNHDYVIVREDHLLVHFMFINFKWNYKKLEGAYCYSHSYHKKAGEIDYANVKIKRKNNFFVIMTLERPYDFLQELNLRLENNYNDTKEEKTINFSYIIPYSKIVYALFGIAWLADLFLLLLYIVQPTTQRFFVPIFVAIIGMILALMYTNHKVKLTSDGLSIILFFPFSIRGILWKDIMSIRYTDEKDHVPWYQKKNIGMGKRIILKLQSGKKIILTVEDYSNLFQAITEEIMK